MDGNLAQESNSIIHTFESADGQKFTWEEQQETEMTLSQDDIDNLRRTILCTSDSAILNDISGNGIPMGVKIPLSTDRLNGFLMCVLGFISLKESLTIRLSPHAEQRLNEDKLNGPGHPDFRGWLSQEDVKNCVHTIYLVEGARLTVDRTTINQSEIRFNSTLALEVRGTLSDGRDGTLALAFIGDKRIRIITLL